MLVRRHPGSNPVPCHKEKGPTTCCVSKTLSLSSVSSLSLVMQVNASKSVFPDSVETGVNLKHYTAINTKAEVFSYLLTYCGDVSDLVS